MPHVSRVSTLDGLTGKVECWDYFSIIDTDTARAVFSLPLAKSQDLDENPESIPRKNLQSSTAHPQLERQWITRIT